MRLAALQAAIYNRLNHASVTDLLSPAYSAVAIFTDTPQPIDAGASNLFPYITYGVTSVAAFDTDDEPGGNAIVQVDVWHRLSSDVALNTLTDAVDARLRRQPLAIPGTTHINTGLENMTMTEDPDGKTKRIMMLFRVLYLG